MENYRRTYGQEGFVRKSISNRKPPLGGNWKPTIPAWEKKFCKTVGSLNWNTFLEKKKYVHMYDNILEWNDSAGEEAFLSAKKRFLAELNGIPCNEDMPDPDLYIDEINWGCQIDEELLSDLECKSVTISDEKSDPVIIFGDSFIQNMPFFSTGWGTGWGEEMPKATGWGDETPKTTGWGGEMPKATGWGDEMPKATGWGDEMPKATGWGDEMQKATGWGDEMQKATGWGDEMQKTTGWGDEMPNTTGWGDEMQKATGWGDEMPKTTGWGDEMPRATGWGEEMPKATGWGEEMPKATGWREEIPKATGWGYEEDMPKDYGNQWATGWGVEEYIHKDHDKENRAGDCPDNSWHLNKGDGFISGWGRSQGMKGEADFSCPKYRNSDYDGSWRQWDNSEATGTRAGMSLNKAPRFHGEGHNSNSSWKGRNQENYSWRPKNTGRIQPKGRWNTNTCKPNTHQASDNSRQRWT